MSLEALLIVLMAGTEIFRPLRDLRTVLHQGMTGQSAAAGINALLRRAGHRAGRQPPRRSRPTTASGADDRLRGRALRLSRRAAAPRIDGPVVHASPPASASASSARAAPANPSIVRLLLRLYDPQCGAVRIGGHDLRALDPGRAAPA